MYRFLPRRNDHVNDTWMCDAGRLDRVVKGENRMLDVLVRGDERFAPNDGPSSLATVGDGLRRFAGAAAIVVSPQSTTRRSISRDNSARRGCDRRGDLVDGPRRVPDDFLIKAEKNPNTQGLVHQGLSKEPGALEPILQAIETGTVGGARPRADGSHALGRRGAGARRARARGAPGRARHRWARRRRIRERRPADHNFPETEGTFTNHAGRVQRIRAAVPAPGQARPGWQVLGDLVAAATAGQPAASASAVFASLAAENAAFSGLDHERIGLLGAPSANARASA